MRLIQLLCLLMALLTLSVNCWTLSRVYTDPSCSELIGVSLVDVNIECVPSLCEANGIHYFQQECPETPDFTVVSDMKAVFLSPSDCFDAVTSVFAAKTDGVCTPTLFGGIRTFSNCAETSDMTFEIYGDPDCNLQLDSFNATSYQCTQTTGGLARSSCPFVVTPRPHFASQVYSDPECTVLVAEFIAAADFGCAPVTCQQYGSQWASVQCPTTPPSFDFPEEFITGLLSAADDVTCSQPVQAFSVSPDTPCFVIPLPSANFSVAITSNDCDTTGSIVYGGSAVDTCDSGVAIPGQVQLTSECSQVNPFYSRVVCPHSSAPTNAPVANPLYVGITTKVYADPLCTTLLGGFETMLPTPSEQCLFPATQCQPAGSQWASTECIESVDFTAEPDLNYVWLGYDTTCQNVLQSFNSAPSAGCINLAPFARSMRIEDRCASGAIRFKIMAEYECDPLNTIVDTVLSINECTLEPSTSFAMNASCALEQTPVSPPVTAGNIGYVYEFYSDETCTNQTGEYRTSTPTSCDIQQATCQQVGSQWVTKYCTSDINFNFSSEFTVVNVYSTVDCARQTDAFAVFSTSDAVCLNYGENSQSLAVVPECSSGLVQTSTWSQVDCTGRVLGAQSLAADECTAFVGVVSARSSCPLDTAPPVIATPIDTPIDAPISAPVDSPVDAPIDTPVSTPVDAPINVPVSAPVASAPVDAPVEAPVDEPVSAPVVLNVPLGVPLSAPVATPVGHWPLPFTPHQAPSSHAPRPHVPPPPHSPRPHTPPPHSPHPHTPPPHRPPHASHAPKSSPPPHRPQPSPSRPHASPRPSPNRQAGFFF